MNSFLLFYIKFVNFVNYFIKFSINIHCRGGNHGGGGGGDYRPIIHYRDLDAPREPDDFL